MKLCALGFATLALIATPALAAPNVVATIKPVNSLVAGVMQGVGEPRLLVEGGNSPHTYTMRPSDAEALQNADLVFWVGPDLEFFLDEALETVSVDAKTVALEHAAGISTLEPRAGGMFEEHDHEHDHDHDHDHAEGDEHHDHGDEDHDHEHEDDHDHADADHDHDGAEHDHDEHIDPHLWLDPDNAKAMVVAIEEALIEADEENAAVYAKNADALLARLDELEETIEAELDPVRGTPFVVFHDAYHYFEQAFAIEASGSVTVDPQTSPGARRIADIREKIAGLNAVCVFTEPQFDPRTVDTIIEGSDARRGVMDPLGADIADGPDLYFELLENLAVSLKSCLE